MDKLNTEQIETRIAELPDWSLSSESLQRTYGFDNFLGAMTFVNRIAGLAEDMQHHPDIMIRYNKVTLTLTTHDAGGVTERDFSLAHAIDNSLVPQS